MRRILVDGEEGRGIPGDDPGLQLGLTVFETLRTYGRQPFRLQAHLDRLEQSAKALEIAVPERWLIESEVERVMAADVQIRYTLTGGGHRICDAMPIDLRRVGAPMKVARVEWEPPHWLAGHVKHGSRAGWVLAARQLKVDEVLLVDRRGYILEANRSNVFAVIDGQLCTPPLDGRFLAGVTRGALLDAAGREGLVVHQVPIHQDRPWSELYLSGTLKELAPVVQIDDQPAAGGGPLGQALVQAFHRLVAEETGAG
ncbi:MAG: aminotransferase class IV family protein [Bradymonadales bacterium]|nr:aminotransferase class IV family protein [Bradymonadales bacterium]